jgi:hypothetical protein
MYKTIILPLVLYGCETWFLILREGHRSELSENRVLRRTLAPKRDEVIEGWRKLRNKESHNVYLSPSKIRTIMSRRVKWVGHVALMGRTGMHIGFWWERQKETALGRQT